ncbi:DUF3010 family protein [Paraferrimonas sp. SM1919]|uniref:DUF3010 family protein n=1 Tax=Paraferrimonas sp. SM1919 TaxID=2662263 RepID=UPI0013D2B072|nr:DUF3010 family protein [Paraferrimonas sp. SM1919]
MRVCGVDIVGSEAIICLLTYEGDTFNIPDCRTRVFPVSKSQYTGTIRKFHKNFSKLMEDYKVDEVVFIERHQKGKHAGSAASFKIETAIQLSDVPVFSITTSQIKEQLKRNPVNADFESMGLKRLQKGAFEAAYAYQNQKIYGVPESE